MIDSICPHALKHQIQNVVPHSPFTSSRCKPEIGFLISNQLKASAKLVQDWIMPSWSSRPWPTPLTSRALIGITAINRFKEEEETLTAGSLSSHGSASPYSSSSGDESRGSSTTAFAFYADEDINHKPSSTPKLLIEKTINNDSDDSNRNSGSPPPPPTTILLRCNDYVPVSKSENQNAISKVDTVRDHRLLGWDEYIPDLVQCVLDVPGHHFSLFAEENVSRSSPPPVHTHREERVSPRPLAPRSFIR